MVGDPQRLEAGLLGPDGLGDEVEGAVLLGGQERSVDGHPAALPGVVDVTRGTPDPSRRARYPLALGAGTEPPLRALSTRRNTTKEPLSMATDYDQPRRSDADEPEDSLEELKARRAEAQSSSVDVDEADLNEAIELPGADLSGEELTVRVLPKQSDEFTCSSCFLVHHRSQLDSDEGGRLICKECA